MVGATRVQRRIVTVASVLLGIAGLVWIGSEWYGGAFVRAVYAGEFLPYLGRLLRVHAANNPAHRELSFYIDLVQNAGRRLFVVCTLFWGVVLLLVRFRPSTLPDYFSEEGSALTLAVFRIAVFGLLLDAVDVSSIVESAHKASDVRYAPALMGWLFNHVPLGEVWVRSMARLMQGACLLALVGFFTRPAAVIAGGLGIYVLGIPELLGKINHGNHFLIWFGLLLGAAPSGDALSVDALIRAWRHPKDGTIARPSPSPRYGRPIRWAWLLIGVIYFFPGFWKFMLSGLDWMLSPNLKFKLYAKWHQLQYIPAVRIDRTPLLYQGLAVFTVVFELFFGVVLLFRRWRFLAVFSGVGFHLGTAYFLRIFFKHLLSCYVVFVPWEGMLRRIGRLIFPTVLTVRYPSVDTVSRRLLAVVRAGDWLRRVRYEEDDHVDHLEVERDGTTWEEWAALGRILIRVPLLWPLVPLIGLAYTRRSTGASFTSNGHFSFPDTNTLVTLTGGTLLAVNVFFGLFLINSWPFSVYPTHAGVSGPYITDVDMVVKTTAGDSLDAEHVLGLAPSRRRGLARQILSAPDSTARAEDLRRLVQLVEERVPSSVDVEALHIYRERLSKIPEQWDENPIDRSLILTVPLAPSPTSSLGPKGARLQGEEGAMVRKPHSTLGWLN